MRCSTARDHHDGPHAGVISCFQCDHSSTTALLFWTALLSLTSHIRPFMSQLQPLHQTTPLVDAPKEWTDTGVHYNHTQSTENQASRGQFLFSDSSGPLFAMYLKIAEEEDKKRAEILRTDTDQILVFCGLFSATVAALLVMSMPDLKPSNQALLTEASNAFLEIIAGVLAFPGLTFSQVYLGNKGFVLKPLGEYATYVTWVNLLWLLSLLISLTCALLAISIQQWARRHAKVTPPRYSLRDQARLRAFFTAGIERHKFDFLLQALLVLVHLSLLFFFSGFLVFMLRLTRVFAPIIFIISCCWIGFFNAAYLFITVLPIFLPDSPYYTPLSIPVAYVYSATRGAVFLILWTTTRSSRISVATREYMQRSKDRYCDFSSWGMMQFAEEKAEEETSEIDGDVLKRTLDALNTDDDLEEFFESVVGFCSSKVIDDPQRSLDILGRERLVEAVDEFWNCTSSSASISESVKERRLILCERLIDVADLGMTLRHTDVAPTAGRVGRPCTTTPPMFPVPVLAGVAAP
ncbi:hypothetical protein BC826DRAFT_1176558 [Russula brevipes]|nr:hypothetical protein BC826DRAFT_1176558 [Russula brevipes]